MVSSVWDEKQRLSWHVIFACEYQSLGAKARSTQARKIVCVLDTDPLSPGNAKLNELRALQTANLFLGAKTDLIKAQHKTPSTGEIYLSNKPWYFLSQANCVPDSALKKFWSICVASTNGMNQAVQEVCWLVAACQLIRSHWLGAGDVCSCSDHSGWLGSQLQKCAKMETPWNTLANRSVHCLNVQPPNLLWVALTNQSSKTSVGV